VRTARKEGNDGAPKLVSERVITWQPVLILLKIKPGLGCRARRLANNPVLENQACRFRSFSRYLTIASDDASELSTQFGGREIATSLSEIASKSAHLKSGGEWGMKFQKITTRSSAPTKGPPRRRKCAGRTAGAVDTVVLSEFNRACYFEIMERPIGIEPTPEPWQVCRERSVNNLRGTFRSTK
jgi:hypothetical protein